MGFKDKFDKLSIQVKEILSKSPRCHDWEHTERVLHNAQIIASSEKNINKKVVKLGALLHDIARADELAINGEICHAKKGAELAEKILVDAGFDKEICQKVAKCVRRHRFRGNKTPVSIEEKIIYDADKLDSVGAVGLGRAFLFAGREGARVHNTKEEAMASSEYSVDDTAYREYLVKQRNIPSKMLTITGRKIALERVKFMKRFFEKLDDEIYKNL
jgi:uncharacterized protein